MKNVFALLAQAGGSLGQSVSFPSTVNIVYDNTHPLSHCAGLGCDGGSSAGFGSIFLGVGADSVGASGQTFKV